MAEYKDLQVMKNITSEVDQAQIKLIFSKECYNSQLSLIQNLNATSQRQKEIWQTLKHSTSKTKAEIENGETELKVMRASLASINSANINLEMEIRLALQFKVSTAEEMDRDLKTYNEQWLECKKRYENLPLVQKWFEVSNRKVALKQKVEEMIAEEKVLHVNLAKKIQNLTKIDQKRVIELARFITFDMKNTILLIKEKQKDIKQFIIRYKESANSKCYRQTNLPTETMEQNKPKEIKNKMSENNWSDLLPSISNIYVGQEFPTNPFANQERNQEVQLNSLTLLKKSENILKTDNIQSKNKLEVKNNESFAASYIKYFNYKFGSFEKKETATTKPIIKQNPINILENIPIDNCVAKHLVSNADSRFFHVVDIISSEILKKSSRNPNEINLQENEQMEIIDITYGPPDVLLPPTQFLDCDDKEDEPKRRRVSFDESKIVPPPATDETDPLKENDIDTQQDDYKNQLEVSNQSYSELRDNYFKKYNLDISPNFVYAKKTPPVNNVQKAVTSKFFLDKIHETETDINISPNGCPETNIGEISITQNESGVTTLMKLSEDKEQKKGDLNYKTVADDAPVNKSDEEYMNMKTRAQQANESLDISINTTGYYDNEAAPHIDSNLLLSPKEVSFSDNMQENIPESSNFLSSVCKRGLSFFGSKEETLDSSTETSGNTFSFDFGGTKKKGGLFNMFK